MFMEKTSKKQISFETEASVTIEIETKDPYGFRCSTWTWMPLKEAVKFYEQILKSKKENKK